MENNNKTIGVSQKAVIFRDDGKILVIRRSETAPSHPLFWDLPGGGIDFGEDARDAIIREIKEETGLNVNNVDILDVISALDYKGEFWITIGYVSEVSESEVKLSHEHDEFRWIYSEEFSKMKASSRNKKFVESFESLRRRGEK
ncbi:MAG: NUDIX hydrolase [Candidatus Moranbacteria bacterium]|nr:NUDIX hydrolase [Candidatus Moranbacteria bacterium]